MVEIVEIPKDVKLLTTLKFRGNNNFYLSKNVVNIAKGLQKGDEMVVIIKSFTKFESEEKKI